MPSILCYVHPSVELLGLTVGPTTPSFQTRLTLLVAIINAQKCIKIRGILHPPPQINGQASEIHQP